MEEGAGSEEVAARALQRAKHRRHLLRRRRCVSRMCVCEEDVCVRRMCVREKDEFEEHVCVRRGALRRRRCARRTCGAIASV